MATFLFTLPPPLPPPPLLLSDEKFVKPDNLKVEDVSENADKAFSCIIKQFGQNENNQMAALGMR